jgi:phage FluMu gp28-like protein
MAPGYVGRCRQRVERELQRHRNRGTEGSVQRVRIALRPYQQAIFDDRSSGILILHWSRQIGKSFTLAAWAVDRLLTRPGRLVTVLSNSRENGAEFVAKCAEVCHLNGTEYESVDKSQGVRFQNMRMEVRVRANGKVGRIKVLAANPRTARGFSGDLILDEFAFHEDSAAIWEAAEPILASNPDFLCRLASTGNGRHNLFYRMCSGVGSDRWADRQAKPATDLIVRSSQRDDPTSGFAVSRITRTQAYAMGVAIYDSNTRQPITPEEARAQALDKRAYDQNYECAFADENLTLLSHELISAAERDGIGFICEQDWSAEALALMRGQSRTGFQPVSGDRQDACPTMGSLYVGFDVGRKVDLSVITVLEDLNGLKIMRGILRMQNLRLPEQQLRLGEICRLPKFRRAAIDMTGLGLGLFEYAQKEFGSSRIYGVNFSTTVPATRTVALEGRKRETVRVTEALAMELLQGYEDRRIRHPADARLRDDLRKPEKITTPGGRVSIAATRDEAGHADHFWSFALAVEAASMMGGPFVYRAVGRAERGVLV